HACPARRLGPQGKAWNRCRGFEFRVKAAARVVPAVAVGRRHRIRAVGPAGEVPAKAAMPAVWKMRLPRQNGNKVAGVVLQGGWSKRRLRGKRILVIEDDFLLAAEVAELLAQLGCIVAGPTGDLDEAYSLVRARLDGAVLDARLQRRETSESVATM